MRSITLIVTLALLVGLTVWAFLRPSPPPELDAFEPGKTAVRPATLPTRNPTKPMVSGPGPQPVTSPREEPTPAGMDGSLQRSRPVYPQEALPFIKPEPVLEPPEPTQTQAVPQSMIDEQNRQNEFQPQPVEAHP